MLNLNLLSPQAKTALAYERYRRAVLTFASGVLAVLAIFLTLLIPSYFFITLQIRELDRSLKLEVANETHAKLRELSALIAEVKQLARRIEAGESKRQPVSPLLAELMPILKPWVAIQSLRFDAESRELTLRGLAATRADFLQARSLLRSHPAFADVSSPVGDIFRERDVEFTLKATLRSP